MPVLSDTQIRELVHIEPFASNEKRPGVVSYGVSSYGYDVRVGTKFKVFTNATSGGTAIVDPKNFTNDLFLSIDTALTGRDYIVIPPNSFALAETVEEIRVPRDILAICVGKIDLRALRHHRQCHPARARVARQGHHRDLQHHAAAREDLRQ